MEELERLLTEEKATSQAPLRSDELPLPLAQDWDLIVSRASRMAEVIDKHLDFESRLQGRDLRPITLCPEQKISLITDLSAV